jgi:prepilin-type N-terminal cleavage/methylation domain-containing protein
MMCKSNRKGFTLIELLATLTIMAVIAAILFPILANYVTKANHDSAVRSLRILQEAMDRRRAVSTEFNQWAIGSSGIAGNSPLDSIQILTADEVNQILSDLLTTGSNQTLKIPIDQLVPQNIAMVSTAKDTISSGWEVMWFRRNTNVTGVDRKKNDITIEHWGTGPQSEDIDTAFQE